MVLLVSPLVYHIFVELYGKDNSPEIIRYVVDIYKAPVPKERLVQMKFSAVNMAKIEVNKIRPEWMSWEREYSDDEDDIALEDTWLCCCMRCGLTKEHIEALIYWAVTCWNSRKKSGRGTISYRKYKPLKGIPDDSTHGDEEKTEEATNRKKTKFYEDISPADRDHDSGTWVQKITGTFFR